MKQRRILIASREPIVGYGLKHLINHQPDLMVCGETQNPSEILEMVEMDCPDLALIGLAWHSKSPFSLIQELTKKFPSLQILVFSRHKASAYGHRAIRVGAGGFVEKQDSIADILVAIRVLLGQEKKVHRKQGILKIQGSNHQASKGNEAFVNNLSNRELEVFHLLGKGFTARQVAEALHISVKTVDTHRDSLKRKVGATSISQLIQKAVAWALFEAAS